MAKNFDLEDHSLMLYLNSFILSMVISPIVDRYHEVTLTVA